ncbi:uncharacterized protein LOC131245914 [Magnolia sinica]|uniref:uncharacterized protein LOC131245914 n=1 Tax=Magnolia sinica TaxID=86752 RepID=UPI0026594279|nr:uncharacterized protein LOC131245914 [Magnolia sinica]XP_058101673.1 uncharacterized protein LOC131245914 [Magnolia sinica]
MNPSSSQKNEESINLRQLKNQSQRKRKKEENRSAMPYPNLNLRTTAHVIQQSSVTFLSSFSTFLILSLLLFSFKTTVEDATLSLTSFLDRDPSLQTLFSRLSSPHRSPLSARPPDSVRSPAAGTAPRPRRRPFLRLTRVGTLDDDFSSSSDYTDSLRLRRRPANGTVIYLSHFTGDGARAFRIATSGFFLIADERGEKTSVRVEADEDEDRPLDLRLFGHGLDLDRRDAAALFFLVSFLSAAYGWVILAFLFSYCCVLGVVFYAVVNSHLGRRSSILETLRMGLKLGVRRLAGFVLLRWAVRDALTQFLGLWFFSDVDDQFSFFKLFVRLKLMPFSVASPWVRGGAVSEVDISGFVSAWVLLDTFVDFVFAVDCWVAIMDTRRSGQEIVREGCYLMSTMLNQAVRIKCLEFIFSGSVARWVLVRIGGRLFASFVLSMAEVYFMVVWLIFYFAVRCKDANLEGRRFGQRDLEDYINGLR